MSGPAFDQATTLSKLLHLGMSLADVIRATTSTPALAVRRAGLMGTLAPGREADLTVLELREGHWALPDAAGQTEVVERLVVPRLVLRAGQLRRIDSPVPGCVVAGSRAAGPAGSLDGGPVAAAGR